MVIASIKQLRPQIAPKRMNKSTALLCLINNQTALVIVLITACESTYRALLTLLLDTKIVSGHLFVFSLTSMSLQLAYVSPGLVGRISYSVYPVEKIET